MKRIFPLIVTGAALIGYFAGHATRPAAQPVLSGHFDDFPVVQRAFAQNNEPEVTPFGFNDPGDPPLAGDAPPIKHWSIDDIKKAHSEMAERAAKLLGQPGSGSSQSFGGGPVSLSTRNFSMFMLYRVHRDQPVLSLTKVNSVWDDAEQHAGAYDFYVFTGGSGQMIVGGKIENRKNLMDKDGPVPGEYRGQPVVGAQTFNVKTGDWLLIPPDTPHQPKPDPGGFSYMIMKINVGIYPWSLIR
jgi:hypothetical protein